MTPDIVEKVGRWLCEYVGGDPDMVDPHAITHEGKPFKGPLWQVFAKDAGELSAIILAEAAKVAREEYESCLAHPQGYGLGAARRILKAIQKAGQV